MVSVVRPLIAAAFSGLIGAWVMPADAAKRQPAAQPVVDPGRPNWFFGPDVQGYGHYPLPWGNGAPAYSGY